MLGPRIHDEPLFFIDRGEPVAAASLLMPADRLIALRHAFSGAAYEEGRDFSIDLNAGTVLRLPGSRMPATALEELSSPIDRDGSGFMFTRDAADRFLLVSE